VVRTLNGTGSNSDCINLGELRFFGSGSITALNGFQIPRDAHPSDPNQFSGFSTSVFSHQTVSRRHVFGAGTHLSTNRSVRWGMLFNNAEGFTSVNTGCGIGFSNLLSAGDWSDGNDGAVTRLNRTARVELYGRD
jgi:hypothetical protein